MYHEPHNPNDSDRNQRNGDYEALRFVYYDVICPFYCTLHHGYCSIAFCSSLKVQCHRKVHVFCTLLSSFFVITLEPLHTSQCHFKLLLMHKMRDRPG